MSRRPLSKGEIAVIDIPALDSAQLVLKEKVTIREAHARLKAQAIQDYQNAKTQQEANRVAFAAQFGSIDRIDSTFVDDARRMLARVSAIAVAQKQQKSSYGSSAEPKVAKLIPHLAALISECEVAMMADRAQDLFAKVDQYDYIGTPNYSNSKISEDPTDWVGEKATGALALLDTLEIVEPEPTTTPGVRVTVGVVTTLNEGSDQCAHPAITSLESIDEMNFTVETTMLGVVRFNDACVECESAVTNIDDAWLDEEQLAQLDDEENHRAELAQDAEGE